MTTVPSDPAIATTTEPSAELQGVETEARDAAEMCRDTRTVALSQCHIEFGTAITPALFVIETAGQTHIGTVLVEVVGGREWPITVGVDPPPDSEHVSFEIGEPICGYLKALCSYPLTLTQDGSANTVNGIRTGSVLVTLPNAQRSSADFAVEYKPHEALLPPPES